MSQLVYNKTTDHSKINSTANPSSISGSASPSPASTSMKLLDSTKSTPIECKSSSWWPSTMLPDVFNLNFASTKTDYHFTGGFLLQTAKDHLMGPSGMYQCGFAAQCQMKMQQAEPPTQASRLSSSCPGNLAQPTSLAHFDFDTPQTTEPSVVNMNQSASVINKLFGFGDLYNVWPSTPSTMPVKSELTRPPARGHLRSASFSTPPKNPSGSSYFPSIISSTGAEPSLKKSRVTVSTSTIPTATSDGPIELMDLLCHQKRLDLLALVLKMTSILCQVMPQQDRRCYSETTLNELVSRLKGDLNQCEFCPPQSSACLTNLEQFKEFFFGSEEKKKLEDEPTKHEDKLEKPSVDVDEQLQLDRQRRKRNKTRKKNRRKRRAKNQFESTPVKSGSDASASSSATVSSGDEEDDDADSYESFENKFFANGNDSDSDSDDLEYEESSNCLVGDEDDDLKIVFSDDVPEEEEEEMKKEETLPGKKKCFPCPISICKGLFMSNLFPSKEDRQRKVSLPPISLGQGSFTETAPQDSNATMAVLPRHLKMASLVAPAGFEERETIKSPIPDGIPIPKSYEFEDSYDYSPSLSSSASPEFPLTEEEIARNLKLIEEEEDIKRRTQLDVAEANRKWNEAMQLEDPFSEDELDSCDVFTLEADRAAVVNPKKSTVTFSPDGPTVYYVAPVKSHWDPDPELEDWSLVALDRKRLEDTISRVLTPSHRDRIYRDRFEDL